jgi:hypothetical protein
MSLPEAAVAYIDRHHEGMTNAELAEKTGVTVARVRRYVQELRKRLGTQRTANKKTVGVPTQTEVPVPPPPPESPPEPGSVPMAKKTPFVLDAPFAAFEPQTGDDLNDLLGIRIEEQPDGFANDERTPAGIRAKKKKRGQVG